jgi:predicted esterase
MIILSKNSNFSSSKRLYIFVHGAYDNFWRWKYIVDDLLDKNNSLCILVSLPGYFMEEDFEKYIDNIGNFINNFNGCFEQIYLVGFSIGGILSGLLCKELSKIYDVILILVSIPIELNKHLIDFRLKIDSIFNHVLNPVPRAWIPINLRGKLKSNYSRYDYLSIASQKLETMVNLFSTAKKVIIICGRLDPIAGSITKQKKLSYSLTKLGVDSKFYDLGYTGHFPLLLKRLKLVALLCNE